METQNFILEACEREVVLTFSAEDLQPHYDKAYLEAMPHIQLQGFRKGKVPLNLLKKHYGKVIENDSMEKIANDGFQEFLQNEDIHAIGRPTLRDIQREPDGSVKFTIRYEVMPEFELAQYRGLELKTLKLDADKIEEEIEDEIFSLLEESATLEPADQVLEDLHLVTVDFRPIDEETGVPILGQEPLTKQYLIKEEAENIELKSLLLNTKVGDTFYYSTPDKNDSTTVHKMLATIQKIELMVLPELTNEFVEQMSNGEFTTTEEYRELVEKIVVRRFTEYNERLTNEQIIQQITAAHTFEPPFAIIESVLADSLSRLAERYPDKKLPANFNTQAYIQQFAPMAFTTAKWLLIQQKIVDAEQIAVEESDIDNSVSEMVATLPNMNVEYIRSALAGNEEFKNQLLQKKLFNILREYAVIEELESPEALSQSLLPNEEPEEEKQ